VSTKKQYSREPQPAVLDALVPCEVEVEVEEYLADVGRYPPLSQRQERLLIEEMHAANTVRWGEFRHRLIEGTLDLAIEMARRYSGRGMELSDLIGTANLGLALAARDFSPAPGRSFRRFAQVRMRWMLTQSTLGTSPTSREWDGPDPAAPLSLDAPPVRTGGLAQDPLCEPGEEQECGTLLDALGNSLLLAYEEEAYERDCVQIQRLYRGLVHLYLRRRQALVLRYRIGQQPANRQLVPLEQVGKQMHISRERVRQIEQQAIRDLRAYFKNAPRATVPQGPPEPHPYSHDRQTVPAVPAAGRKGNTNPATEPSPLAPLDPGGASLPLHLSERPAYGRAAEARTPEGTGSGISRAGSPPGSIPSTPPHRPGARTGDACAAEERTDAPFFTPWTLGHSLTTRPALEAARNCGPGKSYLLNVALSEVRASPSASGYVPPLPVWHHGGIKHLAITSDGTNLALIDREGEIWVYHMESGTPLLHLHRPGETFSHLCWSPGSLSLAASSSSGALWTWDPRSGTAARFPHTSRDAATWLSWDPAGVRLAWATPRAVHVGYGTTGPTERAGVVLAPRWSTIDCLSWSPSGTLLAGATHVRFPLSLLSGASALRIWDAFTGELSVKVALAGQTKALAWSPGGHLVAAIVHEQDDTAVRIWPASSGSQQVFGVAVPHARWLRWSGAGEWLWVLGSDGTISLFSVAEGILLSRKRVSVQDIKLAAWMPGEEVRLAFTPGDHDRVVHFWPSRLSDAKAWEGFR
jgi:RNA polymerase primary sigma factor